VDGKAGAYGVVAPDLPGCTSAGSTTDEALRKAVEAVRLWIEDAIDHGEALPTPRSIEALRADPEVERGVCHQQTSFRQKSLNRVGDSSV